MQNDVVKSATQKVERFYKDELDIEPAGMDGLVFGFKGNQIIISFIDNDGNAKAQVINYKLKDVPPSQEDNIDTRIKNAFERRKKDAES